MRLPRVLRSPLGLLLALVLDVVLFGGPHRPDVDLQRSLQTALHAQTLATDRFIDLDEVVGTAVGFDHAGNHVVKLYLSHPAALNLPPTLVGIPLVIEVTGPFTAGDPSEDDGVDRRGSFERPVPIGVSTGHRNVTAGTIGARVTDGRRVYALSNNHVFAASNGGREGDEVFQPGMVDGARDPDDAIGTLHDFEPIRFCSLGRCPANTMDAAVALSSPDDLDRATPEDGYGTPRPRAADPELGRSVQKYGRTTGWTKGRITGINATIDVRYGNGLARFEDQLVITAHRGTFSAGGDSGSLIVTDGTLFGDRRPVGLLFAGSAKNTIANPIGPVLERFGVQVDGEWR